jgi:hypothetical protein
MNQIDHSNIQIQVHLDFVRSTNIELTDSKVYSKSHKIHKKHYNHNHEQSNQIQNQSLIPESHLKDFSLSNDFTSDFQISSNSEYQNRKETSNTFQKTTLTILIECPNKNLIKIEKILSQKEQTHN